MATRFLAQIRELARSPEGCKVAEEAKRLAKDPRTRARIDEARARLGQQHPEPPDRRGRVGV
jgi:hypothetical protein